MQKSQAPSMGTPDWYKRLFAWVMATGAAEYEAAIAPRKQALFQNLQGTVVELGPGAGPNFRYYPPQIHWVGIEPNPFMHSYLQEEAQKWGIELDLKSDPQAIQAIAANSVDRVVSTLVLCSVPDLAATLADIFRILKPGGRFLFIEHVAAPPGTLLRQIQSGIRPLWRLIGDGCCPDRETGVMIAAAGFDPVDYQHFDGPVPIAIVKPHIVGTAQKPQM